MFVCLPLGGSFGGFLNEDTEKDVCICFFSQIHSSHTNCCYFFHLLLNSNIHYSSIGRSSISEPSSTWFQSNRESLSDVTRPITEWRDTANMIQSPSDATCQITEWRNTAIAEWRDKVNSQYFTHCKTPIFLRMQFHFAQ